jgi:hypothetical protein
MLTAQLGAANSNTKRLLPTSAAGGLTGAGNAAGRLCGRAAGGRALGVFLRGSDDIRSAPFSAGKQNLQMGAHREPKIGARHRRGISMQG